MKSKLFVFSACLFLAGCGCSNLDVSCKKRQLERDKEYEKETKLYNDYYAGKVILLTTAPDGTKLYKVFDAKTGRPVYFSTRSTQYNESCGKSCTNTITVPNSN